MEYAKKLMEQMDPMDKDRFLDTLYQKYSEFPERLNECVNISDMLECAFIWENTVEGHDFWEEMANKYKE